MLCGFVSVAKKYREWAIWEFGITTVNSCSLVFQAKKTPTFIAIDLYMGRSHGGGDNFQKCSEKNYLKIFLLCHYFVLTGILKPHS